VFEAIFDIGQGIDIGQLSLDTDLIATTGSKPDVRIADLSPDGGVVPMSKYVDAINKAGPTASLLVSMTYHF
jgi:hypothetical protein